MGSANNKTPNHLNQKTGPEFLLTVVFLFIVCKTKKQHWGGWGGLRFLGEDFKTEGHLLNGLFI